LSNLGSYWSDNFLPNSYLEALSRRRKQQASKIREILEENSAAEPILDYGAGAGYAFRELNSVGIDVSACDIDTSLLQSESLQGKIIELQTPWSVPEGDWPTVLLLDVLEHHFDPVTFLNQLHSDMLVLKLPMASGPLSQVARLLARVGASGPLEGLFLAGDVMPHLWLPSRIGIARMAKLSGFELVNRRSIVEVGRELPQRLRALEMKRIFKASMTSIGLLLSVMGRFWSDSEIWVLRRN
jgi:hypothetical protein